MNLKQILQIIFEGEDENRIDEMLKILKVDKIFTAKDLEYLDKEILDSCNFFHTVEIRKLLDKKDLFESLTHLSEDIFGNINVARLEKIEKYFIKRKVYTVELLIHCDINDFVRGDFFTKLEVDKIRRYVQKKDPQSLTPLLEDIFGNINADKLEEIKEYFIKREVYTVELLIHCDINDFVKDDFFTKLDADKILHYVQKYLDLYGINGFTKGEDSDNNNNKHSAQDQDSSTGSGSLLSNVKAYGHHILESFVRAFNNTAKNGSSGRITAHNNDSFMSTSNSELRNQAYTMNRKVTERCMNEDKWSGNENTQLDSFNLRRSIWIKDNFKNSDSQSDNGNTQTDWFNKVLVQNFASNGSSRITAPNNDSFMSTSNSELRNQVNTVNRKVMERCMNENTQTDWFNKVMVQNLASNNSSRITAPNHSSFMSSFNSELFNQAYGKMHE